MDQYCTVSPSSLYIIIERKNQDVIITEEEKPTATATMTYPSLFDLDVLLPPTTTLIEEERGGRDTVTTTTRPRN